MNARLLAALALLAGATAASAQGFSPSWELERLQLDPAARGSLVVGTGELPPPKALRLSVAGHVQRRPLVQAGANDVLGRRAGVAIVDTRWTAVATADVVPLPRVELYARFAFVASQDSELTGPAAPIDGDLGMPSFGLRAGIVEQRAGAPLNVALAAELFPPWGTPKAIAKRDEPSLAARIEVGRVAGPVFVGGQAGCLLVERQALGSRTVGPELQYGLSVGAARGAVRPELSLRGGLDVESRLGSAELLGGLRWMSGPLELFGLAGPGFFNEPGTPEWRAVAGLAFSPRGRG